MAAGYLHTSTIQVLIENNADPEQVDMQGRSPLALVESLRAALPPGNPATAGRRLALEEVLKCLTENVRCAIPVAFNPVGSPSPARPMCSSPQLFEDVLPESVLDCRDAVDEEGESVGYKEYLVKFEDCEEAIWVPERYVSEEVAQDYEEGLVYDLAEKIVDHRNRGDSRSYKILWMDGTTSWAPEEWVSSDLIFMYENHGLVPDGVKL